MHDDELVYLESMMSSLSDGSKITEWGSGGSTTMFAELLKPEQRLVSIEHNPIWFKRVWDSLSGHRNKDRIQYFLVQLNINCKKMGMTQRLDYTMWDYGELAEENPVFMFQYIDPNIGVEGLDVYDSDVYFVDGVVRAATLATIFVRAKNRSAQVYIHDYVGREDWYDWATRLYSKKEIVGTTLCRLYF